MGLGSVIGEGEFMQHRKSTGHHIIRAISISTGWNAAGMYEIYNVESKYYKSHESAEL